MQTFKQTVVATAKAMVTSDGSSKTLFNDTIALLKGAEVKDIKSSIRGLVEEAKEALSEDYTSNFTNRIVKTIRLAGNWYGKKLFTRHESLYMYNIEQGLRVLDALEDEDIKKVKNKLNRIKFVDKIQYNNDFETKIKEAMKEYSLADVDGAIVSLENRLTKIWDNMTIEQQNSFLNFISKNCKVSDVA